MTEQGEFAAQVAARVRIEVRDHVAHVTLTRGDKMNAVDPAMAEAIVAAGESLRGREDIRAVVLAAEGRAFCAGLDVASFGKFASEDPVARVMPRTHGDANLMQQVCMVWREIEVPVIAAMQGVAFGAGLQLAMGADIRIAHPETNLAIMEAKWGLVPDMGGMVIWPGLIRSDVLRLMTYTAEPVDAAQALSWGLVTQLKDDPLAEAQRIADVIAGKSPSATRGAKRLIALAESGATAAEVLLAESREQAALIGGAHQLEVIAANMAGRAPNFD
ncbi:crotonase/enoyl-CoA hydratase family protein [Pseudooceanicola sediminis]|uniref:Crotonase/enoyl-CoA hydratase family protein n=1 Tax=Pseudooceanicola sediminis TaxID=2211117 RepID=A0A399IV32_9RHOB|nr:crotonase/enoyl-CoA hydratase family protein [Pseudooceanicola sediminis]KAA2311469.1 crotonase/enoyl-CoA hydratase family protein [Puniceibacterium sp. HSS470]RII36884.1 crotonase/enoyl-CoA hydratase family protein [Pseudooceanicola sediminis]